ncbi:FKBP-type peptidyl-prolyl cis-trans isomerase [Spirosoma sp. KNUC1025]|uniref:FKBP-type peptidyl-prolyl cis-trans isomerase n=1 Tax=Spirosoma sp. KNUC1025 TaxID=2894082 RepID=UPI00386F0734|nr:FKBP-type peptidyl-prolyl cis-trans isomerase [Spirosoma sp. KNUC1025]
MRKLHSFIFSALLLGAVAACTSSVDPGTDPNAVYQSNLADISNYASSKGLTGTSTNSGLYYLLTKPGSASAPAATIGKEVEFNYTMYVLSRSSSNTAVVTDKKLDSLYTTTPVYYLLSPYSTQSSFVPLLPGLQEGLLKMREGDQATLLMPSALAFGDQSSALLPANSPVRFDVTLRRARTEDQQINEYMTANKLTPTEVTQSGLRFIKTANNSSGASPTSTQTLIVKYKGKLLRSASAFDSTGTGTAAFTLGRSIAGFEEGLTKLKVGEKATLIFPSAIGYGQTGNQVIPPYAPLRFDIELVSVQ